MEQVNPQYAENSVITFLSNNLKVGYIGLEESVQRTLQGLVGIDLNVPLHLNEDVIEKEELKGCV